jgi:hypothetical protein
MASTRKPSNAVNNPSSLRLKTHQHLGLASSLIGSEDESLYRVSSLFARPGQGAQIISLAGKMPPVKQREIIRRGLSENSWDDAGLGNPMIALAGGTLCLCSDNDYRQRCSLRYQNFSKVTLWLIAYQYPHRCDVSDAISLLTLSDATSLTIQLARDGPNGTYEDIILTLQALVRLELLRRQQEGLLGQCANVTSSSRDTKSQQLFRAIPVPCVSSSDWKSCSPDVRRQENCCSSKC